MALVALQKGTQITVPDLGTVLDWLFRTHVAPPVSNKEEGDREDKAKLLAAAASKTLGADPERMNCVEHTFLAALAIGWFACDQNRFLAGRSKLLALEEGKFTEIVDVMGFEIEC